MENVSLKLHFRANFIEVIVEDTDKCVLMDIINDLYDGAEKEGIPLPKHPSLAYSYKMKSITLNNDKDLMEMFSRFDGKKIIDIWIGGLEEPSHVLTLARQLRANNRIVESEVSKVSNAAISEVPKVFEGFKCIGEKLTCKRNVSNSNATSSVAINQIASNSFPAEPTSPLHTQQSELVLTPRRSPRFSQRSLASNVAINNKRTSPKLNLPLVNQYSEKQVTNVKLARTTALKMGVYVPKVRGASNALVVRSERGEQEEGLSDLEEENGGVSALNYDGYNPYKEPEWNDEGGGYSEKLFKNGEVYQNKLFGAIRLKPWQLFMDKEHFKDVLRDYCVQEGFYLVVVKSEWNRYTADCATADCGWRIHASVLPDETTWAIKSIRCPDHGCAGVRTNNPMANCVWVAKKMIEDIRANPVISAQSIKDLLMQRYGLEMASSSVYKMKEIALREINGGHDESYKLLCQYVEVIKLTNPSSIAHCSGTDMGNPEKTLQFKSIFISFQAQFMGLIRGCRSLIGVDGTHLKGNHGGVLLSAVALDGNNEMFPVAIAVVEAENKDSWCSFFTFLKQCVAESGRTNWTIISDRQKGVEPALDMVWPDAYRRFCARHLSKNFKQQYPGLLMYKLFWMVVNATSEYTFKRALEQVIQHGGNGCARWFLDLGDKEQWTKHKFDPELSCEDNTSNFVESFNSTLGVHRTNPVLSLLEGVRRMTMVRNAARQKAAQSWPDEGICPNISERLKELQQQSRLCYAHTGGNGEVEVQDGGFYFPVSLTMRTCLCGQWQISGIPFKHAIRAILEAKRNPKDYVSDWFSVRRYKETYGLSIHPIADKAQWPVFDVPYLEPPSLRRSIGRPSRNRRREPGEEQKKGRRSVTVKCTKCGCFGHNKKTCKGGYTAKQRQQLQGKFSKKPAHQGLSKASTSNFASLADLETIIMGSASASTQPTRPTQPQVRRGRKRKTNA